MIVNLQLKGDTMGKRDVYELASELDIFVDTNPGDFGRVLYTFYLQPDDRLEAPLGEGLGSAEALRWLQGYNVGLTGRKIQPKIRPRPKPPSAEEMARILNSPPTYYETPAFPKTLVEFPNGRPWMENVDPNHEYTDEEKAEIYAWSDKRLAARGMSMPDDLED